MDRGILRAALVCAALFGAVPLFGQTQPAPAPLIGNISHRQTVSLDGSWRIIVDPYNTGYYDYRLKPRSDGYFQNTHPGMYPKELIEYAFTDTETLEVPGDWNSQRKDLFFYEGPVWYEKDFTYHAKSGDRVFLYVGAANYFSRVWVNGEKACEHEGGFTPFDCEITGVLADGDNFAVISVDNTRRPDGVPTVNTDWWNYGGLTRDVQIVEVPRVFINDYSLQLKKDTADQITGSVHLRLATAPAQVRVRIPELNIDQEFTTNSSSRADVKLHAPGLELWSPEHPKLYDVEISAGSDAVKDRIGFRTIEVSGTDILLNGKPVFLRGISIQEEAPYRSGRAYSEEDARTLLGWAKELGANYVRLAHWPHNENMVRLADEMGLMVWSEIPVYWTIHWSDPATLANAQQQLTDMITRDRNRASVIIWSVGNEAPVSPERVQFMKSLVQAAHEQDPSRLVSAALETHSKGNIRIVDDPLGQDLDVVSSNEYIGWYDHKPEDADSITWQIAYNKPLIISEFGADAKFGLHGKSSELWTEEYQENLYEHQFVMLDKIPTLRGMSPWVLMDFRSPRRPLQGTQDYYNRKGLLSDKGEKKKAFFTLKAYYEKKAQQPAP